MLIRKYLYYLSSIPRLLFGLQPWPRVLKVFLTRQESGYPLITVRRAGVRLLTRGVMDIWSVKETFLDRFYERYGTVVQDGWKVVDIGGGIGDYTIFAALGRPRARVFAFEPTPESFALLQENLRLNGIQNVLAFAEAVWSGEGSLSIDTTQGEPGQYASRAGGETPGGTRAGQVSVPSLSLAQALQRTGAGQIDLLKLDCEGAEYPILFSAPEAALGRLQRIVMEYHDNLGQYTHKDLEAYLGGKGFRVRSHPNAVHDYLGYLYAERGG